MKLEVFYPYIAEKPDIFVAFSERWIETYLKHPAGVEHRLIVGCCKAPLTRGIQKLFSALKCDFYPYNGEGFDIGPAQMVAHNSQADFLVAMTSRTYFWKEGWLKAMADAFDKYGDGLYGPSGSFEGHGPHIRGCMYGLSPKTYRRYPHLVLTRGNGPTWENSPQSLTNWYKKQRLPVKMVCWDGVYDESEWRKPDNIFRRGDQSNLICFDKHSQIYELETENNQRMLARQADGFK